MILTNVMARIDRGGHVAISNAVNVLSIVWRQVLSLPAFLECIGDTHNNSWPGELRGKQKGGRASFDAINRLQGKVGLKSRSLFLLQVPFDPTNKGL